MILSCPSCRTRYAVPDNAIGLDGRKVRCAQCRFSWFQDGPEPLEAVAPPPPLPSRRAASQAPAAVAEPATEVVAQPDPIAWTPAEPAYEEPGEPPRRARRNPARLWTWAAIVSALLMVGALTALYFVGPQQLAAWVGGAAPPAGGETLRFTRKDVAREPLPTGRDLLTITGEITNVSGETQSLPQIRADVTDADQNVIFTWMIAPPVGELQPGQAVIFSSASTNVPKGGRNVNLTFRPGG